ncbi:protein NLP3-like [Rhododendron vialii]|uniref:protein NLP3-like n=1 Tax=Rhododendron vialii TaxID=182163 RepID=UPI00265D9921|nr:protein NLP3-like [Rhododendron vialii]
MKSNSKTLNLLLEKNWGKYYPLKFFIFRMLGHLDQPLLDAINDGRDDIRTKEGGPVATSSKGGTTKIQEGKQKKSGVRFDISLDDVLRFSALSRTNAARELKVSVSTLKRVCRKWGIQRWPPHDTNKEAYAIALPNVEDIVHLDSPEEPSLMEFDDAINGAQDLREDDSRPFITHLEKESLPTFKDLQQHFDCKSGDAAKSHGVSAERNNLDVTCSKGATIKTQERGLGKAGVRIEIPLEDILQYSNKRLDFASSELKVSVSTLKRICRNYGIERWPPRNIKRVCHFQPSPVENQGQTPPPSNLTSPSVAHKTQAFQDEDMVTTKAKYENNTFKFQLSLSSRLLELQQELAKRLNLDAGTYYVKYKDEEDDLIAIACDEDLQSCLHISRSLGNTSTVVLLELKDA